MYTSEVKIIRFQSNYIDFDKMSSLDLREKEAKVMLVETVRNKFGSIQNMK